MDFKFFNDGKGKIIAVSYFNKKAVKGIAKCCENDKFNEDVGRELAAERCTVKVLKKKTKKAAEKYLNSLIMADRAERKAKKLLKYYCKVANELHEAETQLIKFENTLSE